MKKITKCIALIFVISLGFISPVHCQQNRCQQKDPTSSKIYEQALMKYVLAYEAFQQAKTDPNKKSQLPLYIRKYRESYAQYLELMRENNLYNPADKETRNDPVTNFNKLRRDNKKPNKKFKPVDTSKARQQVREKVDNNEDPEEIVEETTANSVPEEGFSAVDYEEAGWDPDDPYCDMPPEWNLDWPPPPWWIPPEKRGADFCPMSPTHKHDFQEQAFYGDPSEFTTTKDSASNMKECTFCHMKL